MLVRRILLGCAVVAVVAAAVWNAQRDTQLASTSRPTVPTTTTVAALATEVATPDTTGVAATTKAAPRPAPPPPPGIGVGARGPEVLALEQKLTELHYDPGNVDGYFDSNTGFAVVAFQKVNGMARTSRATDDVRVALGAAQTPPPLVPGGGAGRVEIDVGRQVLFLYQGDQLFKIIPVSTGSGERYCVKGDCARALTPAGSFRVFQKVRGWQTSRLGRLYNPMYFNGGIAIHGSLSVPAYPASHGCVRVQMGIAEYLPKLISSGTPVYVKNGPNAPVPFNEPAPNGTPPQAPPPTAAPPPSTAPPATTTTTPATTTTTTAGVVLQ